MAILRPQTSDLRPQTSDLRPQTSDLRPQTFLNLIILSKCISLIIGYDGSNSNHLFAKFTLLGLL